MKSDWMIKKLYEIVDFNPKESIKKGTIAKKISMDQLLPFCRDVKGYVEEKFSGGTKFRNGDTIMARITPCLENGKIAQISVLDDGEIGFGSTEYIVFRAKEGITDPNYIYYLVCSPEIREPAVKSMVGSSGRQRVQLDVIQNLSINLPTLAEQREIGKFLGLLDEKIALNKEINDNLTEQIQLLYNKFFADCYCDKIPMSSLIEVRDGTHDSPKPKESGMSLVTSKHLLPYGVDKSSANLISEEDYNKVNERSKVNTYDILLSMIGTVGMVSFIIENPVDFAIKNVGLFKTSDCLEMAYYIHCYLLSSSTKQLLEQLLAGSTQKYISLNELRKLPICMPSNKLLKHFNTTVEPCYKTIITNINENKFLNQLRDLLLPKLMSGELDVSNLDL